jgi:hypothetical protein
MIITVRDDHRLIQYAKSGNVTPGADRNNANYSALRDMGDNHLLLGRRRTESCPNKLRAPDEAYATAQQAHQSAEFARHEMGAYEIAHDRTAPHDA